MTKADQLAEALEPCPFCGAHGPSFAKNIGDNNRRHQIKCTECPGRCDFFSSTVEQSVAAWNRRSANETAHTDFWQWLAKEYRIEDIKFTAFNMEAAFEAGRQQGMAQERALWELSKINQEMDGGSV